MISRAIRWYFVSLSLLVLAPAAFACDVATPSHDCCPGGEPTSCNSPEGGTAPAAPANFSCCAAVPSLLPLATLAVSPRVRVNYLPDDLPATYIRTAMPVLVLDQRIIGLSASPDTRRFALDSEPIYLLTRRLRL